MSDGWLAAFGGPVYTFRTAWGARVRGKLFTIAVAFGVVLTAPALAQKNDDNRHQCASNTAAPDVKIAACSAVIQAGGGTNKTLNAALYNRGGAYSAAGQYDKAIADFTQALQLNPGDGILYIGRGNAYLQNGDFDYAGPDFDAAIRLHAQPAVAYSGKGMIDFVQDRYDRAIEDFGQTVRLQPGEAEGFTMRCLARAIVGKLQEAMADCNQAIKLNAKDAEAYSNRGLVYLKMKQPAAALANYHQALEQEPGGDTLLYGQGIAKHMLGDKEGGDADIAEATKLSPDIAAVFTKWGVSEP